MKRRIIYVLLFTLLYHIGYRPAFAAEMMQGTHKSPIATVGYKDKSIYKDSQDYILIDNGSLLNESEDEEESTPVSKINITARWALYQHNAGSLVGKNRIASFHSTTTRDKEKYIFIRVFRV